MRPWGVRRLFRYSSRTSDEVRADVASEFAFHLDARADDLMRSGLSEDAARAQAAREFGNASAGAAICAAAGARIERRRRFAQYVAELEQDARLAARMLARSPSFAAVAIVTLALGIGANTAIYSVLDAVWLRPLPYANPDALVQVSETQENGRPNGSVSGGAFLDWRAHQTQFRALALLNRVSYNLRAGDVPERLTGLEVSHEFLEVLGVQPLLGRGFLPDDDRPGGRNDVVVLTEELWRTRFGASPDIVGRSILLDEVRRTVIGILPRGAWMLREDAFFVPAVLAPGTPRAAHAPHWALVFGRLEPHSSVPQADAELKAVRARLAATYPAFKQRWGVVVQPVADVLGGITRAPALILLGAVSLVLLIACANVANLLLARACHRQQEFAVRAALGAGRGRLARQLLTENLTLASLGGFAGIGAAYLAVRALRGVLADVIPFSAGPQLNTRVLFVTLVVTLATGVLVGLLPALRVRRPGVGDMLKEGGRSSTAGARRQTQALLVTAEVALTVVLLASAGLLLRSLGNAATVDPGFDPARVLAVDLSLPSTNYESNEKRLAFAAALLERLRALPDVTAAGSGMAVPFSGGGYGEYFGRIDTRDGRDRTLGRVSFVSPGFLEALGVRLLRGRFVVEADNRPDIPRVGVINETAARAFFADADPIGQRLLVAGDPVSVVGVIADIVDVRLDTPRGPFAYLPQAFDTSRMSIVVRTPGHPLGIVAEVRAEILRLDRGVAPANPRALDEAKTGSLSQRQLVLALVATFALAALALACMGLYGVMAYDVAQRRRELGIRMALGAARRDIVRQVLHGGLRTTGVGVVLGLAAALGASRLLASELFQVGGGDTLVLGGTTLVVVSVAGLACWLPARRASRFDPIAVLRAD